MRALTARGISASVVFVLRKSFLGIAILVLLLSFAAFPARADDTLETFSISVSSWSFVDNIALAIDPSSTVTIDTTTGEVVSSNLIIGSNLVPFISQQQAGTGTLLNFGTGNGTVNGAQANISFLISLPGSLVGYNGGAMCTGLGDCPGNSGPGSSEFWFDVQNSLMGGGGQVGVGNLTPPPPDFSISSNPSSASVQQGQNAIYIVTLTPLFGFTGNVQFSVLSGLPPNAAATFSPNPVAGAGSTTMTVSTTSATPIGQSDLVVRGVFSLGIAGFIAHTTTVVLNVTAPPEFSVSVTPTQQTASVGSPAKFHGTITPAPGFTGNVTLAVLGLPANSNIEFDPPVVVGGSDSFEFTIAVNSKASPGTYAVSVTGSSSDQTQGTPITLTIQ